MTTEEAEAMDWAQNSLPGYVLLGIIKRLQDQLDAKRPTGSMGIKRCCGIPEEFICGCGEIAKLEKELAEERSNHDAALLALNQNWEATLAEERAKTALTERCLVESRRARAEAQIGQGLAEGRADSLARDLSSAREALRVKSEECEAARIAINILSETIENPPPDVQELVIKKLNLVSGEALEAKQKMVEKQLEREIELTQELEATDKRCPACGYKGEMLKADGVDIIGWTRMKDRAEKAEHDLAQERMAGKDTVEKLVLMEAERDQALTEAREMQARLTRIVEGYKALAAQVERMREALTACAAKGCPICSSPPSPDAAEPKAKEE